MGSKRKTKKSAKNEPVVVEKMDMVAAELAADSYRLEACTSQAEKDYELKISLLKLRHAQLRKDYDLCMEKQKRGESLIRGLFVKSVEGLQFLDNNDQIEKIKLLRTEWQLTKCNIMLFHGKREEILRDIRRNLQEQIKTKELLISLNTYKKLSIDGKNAAAQVLSRKK